MSTFGETGERRDKKRIKNVFLGKKTTENIKEFLKISLC